MTQLLFNELAAGAQIGVQTTDRGVISGVASFLPTTTVTQSTWFVSSTGSTTAEGTSSSTAITEGERQRRWGLLTALAQPTTVTYLDSPTEQVFYNVAYLDGGSLALIGTPTTTQQGVALTAVAAFNRASDPPVPWAVTGATFGAADVFRLLTISGGARDGNYAAAIKDNGGGSLRTGPFGNLSVNSALSSFQSFPQVTPQIGDVVDVQTLPTLKIASFQLYAFTRSQPTGTSVPPFTNCVVFDSIAFDGFTGSSAMKTGGTIEVHGANVFYRRCTVQNVRILGGGGHWMAGGLVNGIVQCQGVYSINGGPFCLFNGVAFGPQASFGSSINVFSVHPGATCVLDGDCTFQNCALLIWGFVYGGRALFFDSSVADFAVQVLPGGVCRIRTFNASPMFNGTDNLGVGMKVFAGAVCTYTVKPQINTALGAGRQSKIGGTATDWAAVPATVAGGAILVDQ